MATEECVVGDNAKFTAILARPSIVPNMPALEKLSGDAESANSLSVWLASLSLELTKSQSNDGKLSVNLDGKPYTVQAGEHFKWNNME